MTNIETDEDHLAAAKKVADELADPNSELHCEFVEIVKAMEQEPKKEPGPIERRVLQVLKEYRQQHFPT
ncbi:MAG: hypothetical protein AAGD43_26195 [Pseudomonadota bacterium]